MELNESDVDEVLGMCICMTCPSWVNCGDKGGYCLSIVGRSRCIEEAKACFCPRCRAFIMAGLNHTRFCIRGSEEEQSNDEENNGR